MIIYRHVIDRIKPWIGKEKIILLTGPRQVGKTTILKILEGELRKEFKTFFYSCDLEIGNPLFKEARLFINLLQSELGHDLPPLDRSRYDGKKPGGLLNGDGLLAISSGFVLS